MTPADRQRLRAVVFPREGYACAYCASPAAPSNPLTLEHILPRSAGGPDATWNLIAACRACNGARGSTPMAVWMAFLQRDRPWMADLAHVVIRRALESRGRCPRDPVTRQPLPVRLDAWGWVER